jgi:hypothetical protein
MTTVVAEPVMPAAEEERHWLTALEGRDRNWESAHDG